MSQPRHPEYQYLDLLEDILQDGDRRIDRTGVGTLAVFGRTMRFDLSEGFPLLTTKKVAWRTAFKEMLWMLSGGDNIRPLLEQNVHIWSEWPHRRYVQNTGDDIPLKVFEERVLESDEFAERWGGLGPVYGKQWRSWKTSDGQTIDQVETAIDLLRNDPSSRRILWDGWNVGEIGDMLLPPCHKHYQFFVHQETGRLSGALAQRSGDSVLGAPWNLANLALVTTMLAQQTGYEVGEIVWFGMDVHIYLNHLDQAYEQLKRAPKPFPRLVIKRKPDSLFDYKIDDFLIEGYDPHPHIQAPVAV